MDISFQCQNTEAEARRLLRNYYFYINAPSGVTIISEVILFVFFALINYGDRRVFWIVIALGCMVLPVWSYKRFFSIMFDIFHRRKLFSLPSEYHLTDTFFEIKHGNDFQRTEYSIFDGYFSFRNSIFVLNHKFFGAGFDLNDLPDHGTDLISCLKNCGLKEVKFWSFKHWWRSLCVMFFGLLVIVMIVLSRLLRDY